MFLASLFDKVSNGSYNMNIMNQNKRVIKLGLGDESKKENKQQEKEQGKQ